MISFKDAHFPQDIILMAVRWYVAYSLSYRQIEELLAERHVSVDHATLQRWVVKYSPLLAQAFKAKKKPVGKSWYADETYLKIKGQWYYYYRAIDKQGQTLDCWKRDKSTVQDHKSNCFRQLSSTYTQVPLGINHLTVVSSQDTRFSHDCACWSIQMLFQQAVLTIPA